jgi:hypothetical protein
MIKIERYINVSKLCFLLLKRTRVRGFTCVLSYKHDGMKITSRKAHYLCNFDMCLINIHMAITCYG